MLTAEAPQIFSINPASSLTALGSLFQLEKGCPSGLTFIYLSSFAGHLGVADNTSDFACYLQNFLLGCYVLPNHS